MNTNEDEEFDLVSLEEESPGWITYKLVGSNGNPITGGRAGTIDEVREELLAQIHKANRRRLIRQRWVYWNWRHDAPNPAV
jgi:hypothetical protein